MHVRSNCQKNLISDKFLFSILIFHWLWTILLPAWTQNKSKSCHGYLCYSNLVILWKWVLKLDQLTLKSFWCWPTLKNSMWNRDEKSMKCKNAVTIWYRVAILSYFSFQIWVHLIWHAFYWLQNWSYLECSFDTINPKNIL